MSTSMALGFVGAAIGGVFGLGQLGYAIGSAVGAAISAPDVNTEGPRLEDLSITDSAQGNPIPRILGAYRVACQVLYAEPLKEVKTESEVGGKGGEQTQTTYTYFFTGALAICEAPSQGILGIRKVWANGKLIWDAGESVPVGGTLADAFAHPGGTGFTPEGLAAVFEAIFSDLKNSQGDNLARYVELHRGAWDQEPDTRMVARLGAENTPAYRGLAYMMFRDLPLADYGNRPPNIEVEVLVPIETGELAGVTRSNGVPLYKLPDGQVTQLGTVFEPYDYRNATGQTQWLMNPDTPSDLWLARLTMSDMPGATAKQRFQTRGVEVLRCVPGQQTPVRIGMVHLDRFQGHELSVGEAVNTSAELFHINSTHEACFGLYRHGAGDAWDINFVTPDWQNSARGFRPLNTIKGVSVGTDSTFVGHSRAAHTNLFVDMENGFLDVFLTNHMSAGANHYWRIIGTSARRFDLPPECSHADFVRDLAIIPQTGQFQADIYTLVGVTAGAAVARVYKHDINGNYSGVYAELTTLGAMSMNVAKDGSSVYVVALIHSDGAASRYGLYEWRPSTGSTTFTLLGELERSVLTGGAMDGGDGGNSYFSAWSDGNLVLASANEYSSSNTADWYTGIGAWRLNAGNKVIGNNRSPTEITVGDIVRFQCRRAGIADEDVTCEGLDDVIVSGYADTRISSPRAAIEPLRSYLAFDMIERGSGLAFVRRGAPIVRVIDEDDLGAFVEGESGVMRLEETRTNELDLPREVKVTYADVGGDYQDGEQYARRNAGGPQNVVDVSIPIAMTAGWATSCANVLLYSALAARSTAKFSLTLKHADLEPGDCVEIRRQRWRILSREDSQGILKFEAASDNARVYDQSHLLNAYASAYGNQTTDAPPLPIAWLFDLPSIRGYDDNAPHIYAAIRPIGPLSKWKGAAIIDRTSSTAEGDIASAQQQTAVADRISTIGFVDTPPAATDARYVDTINQIIVQLVGPEAELASVSDAEFLAGANEAIVGDEIIAFQNAEVIGASDMGLRYRLTNLLRGRRGTATGHLGRGEQFVLLSTVRSVYVADSRVGKETPYLIVPRGNNRTRAIEASIDCDSASVRPLPALHARAGRDVVTGDIVFAWVGQRMTNLGGLETVEETGTHYEIECINGNGEIIALLSGSGSKCTFTVAQNIAEFGVATYSGWTARLYRTSPRWGRSEPVDIVMDV